MADWKKQKWVLLNMRPAQKRKLYQCSNYKTIDDMTNYKEFALPPSRKIKHRIIENFNKKIRIFTGDITCLEIDAIVNAANEMLQNGGGICGRIFTAASVEYLQRECNSIGGCPEGDARITGGYKLPAKYIIHAVGPRYINKPGRNNAKILESTYRNSMDILNANGLTSIAFPCISTGIFNFPNKFAAKVALKTTRKWLKNHPQNKIKRIIFCLYEKVDQNAYAEELAQYYPF